MSDLEILAFAAPFAVLLVMFAVMALLAWLDRREQARAAHHSVLVKLGHSPMQK